ncbi:type II toxin-antitoxin system Phd/YefM family antitoxin [Nocardiopsis sp. CNT312]|uniref:type II toxin-antitoxin system Phd/YefM family antitoxin n=1 Tax=Nocardiopsis sp. CNT312 TaxID=1137268 RepID=UPI00048D7886|nr:type II toxin-antitoxin system prevent-host-death family antitoxin [Nocardiopsis sp. CNT312]
MTETLSSREFRAHLAEAIDRAKAGESTVVTRNGRAVGAFVPMEVLERARRRDEGELRRLIEERRDSPTVPMTEVMAETLGRDE